MNATEKDAESSTSGHEPSSGFGEAAPLLLGDRYEILALLGEGGMGTVYRARDVELDETVALKMLRSELVEIPEILERFRREVKLARRVTHRNVARVFDIGEHGGAKFLTMEFIDGESLEIVLTREGRFSVARALEIACGICAGLSSAHAVGVVHRDLKPDNVLLARDGRVVVTDFGIARALLDVDAMVTLDGPVGTPGYMAPEQLEGRMDVDARADIYAFGELLYELCTGERAWLGETAFAVAAARLSVPPPDPRHKRPDLPSHLAELVMRCMARRREDRFATIDDVAAELNGLTVPAVMIPGDKKPSVYPPVTVRAAHHPDTPLRPGDKTVAVLPFRNAGPEEDAYLAEELTDDLIDNLSIARGLRIRSRGAVMQFKGMDRDAREIGRELGVQVVVEGSVRKARGNVRISARLTCVTDGFQLWAKRFERPERDVLMINDEVASAIAAALTVGREAKRETRIDSAAVDLYLRARNEYRKFWRDAQQRALVLFGQAERLAPDDPMILSGKAMAMARQAFFSGEGFPEALTVARRAVAIAPMLAEARLALGTTLLHTGDWKAGARELRDAVSNGPGLAEAHGTLGRLLGEVGAMEVAIHFLETALSLDPQIPLARTALARSYGLLRDWGKVDALLEGRDVSVPELTPRVRLCLWRGDRDRAAALMEGAAKGWGGGALSPLAVFWYVIHGQLPDRLAIAPPGSGEGGGVRRRTFLLQVEAESAAFLGDDERALSALKESAESGLFDIVLLDRCPLFDALRADPRFAEIRALVAQRADEILAAYHSS